MDVNNDHVCKLFYPELIFSNLLLFQSKYFTSAQLNTKFIENKVTNNSNISHSGNARWQVVFFPLPPIQAFEWLVYLWTACSTSPPGLDNWGQGLHDPIMVGDRVHSIHRRQACGTKILLRMKWRLLPWQHQRCRLVRAVTDDPAFTWLPVHGIPSVMVKMEDAWQKWWLMHFDCVFYPSFPWNHLLGSLPMTIWPLWTLCLTSSILIQFYLKAQCPFQRIFSQQNLSMFYSFLLVPSVFDEVVFTTFYRYV